MGQLRAGRHASVPHGSSALGVRRCGRLSGRAQAAQRDWDANGRRADARAHRHNGHTGRARPGLREPPSAPTRPPRATRRCYPSFAGTLPRCEAVVGSLGRPLPLLARGPRARGSSGGARGRAWQRVRHERKPRRWRVLRVRHRYGSVQSGLPFKVRGPGEAPGGAIAVALPTPCGGRPPQWCAAASCAPSSAWPWSCPWPCPSHGFLKPCVGKMGGAV